MKGIVVKFDNGRKFGFIRCSEDSDDIFFHQSDIVSNPEKLAVGCTVSFDQAKGDKGPKAVRISVSKTAPVSPYRLFAGAAIFLTALFYVALIMYGGFTRLPAYLIGINLSLFALCGFDKSNSAGTTARVPEKVLYVFAAIGGSLGLILGMYFFRHKTKKASFQLGLGVIVMVQIVAIRYLQQYFHIFGNG